MADRKRIFKRLHEDFDTVELMGMNQGFTCIGVFLRGSQNYNLDDEHSDIDSLAIVLPNLDNLIKGYKPSIEHHNEDDSHIDIKDIRYFFDSLKKQNPSYLEMMTTDYYVLDNNWKVIWDEFWNTDCPTTEWGVLSNREAICCYHPYKGLRTIFGDMTSKYKNLFHDAPHSHEDIEKYGYCLKDFHHLNRMKGVLVKYLSYILQGKVEPEQRANYKSLILVEENTQDYHVLMDYKRNGHDFVSVKTMADTVMKQYGNMVEQTLENWKNIDTYNIPNEFLGDQMDRFASDCIRMNVEEEILGPADVVEEEFIIDE